MDVKMPAETSPLLQNHDEQETRLPYHSFVNEIKISEKKEVTGRRRDVALALLHAVGVPAEFIHSVLKEQQEQNETITIKMDDQKLIGSLIQLQTQHIQLLIMEEFSKNHVNAHLCIRILETIFNAFKQAIERGWSSASGIVAVGYGLGFGFMAFSIANGSTPLAILMILPAWFSVIANYLQADEALFTLLPDMYKKITDWFGNKNPALLKVMSTIFILSVLCYFSALPAAALVSETVRNGLFDVLKGFGVKGLPDELGKGSIDHFVFEAFIQIVRTMFLGKTLLTLPDAYRAAEQKIKEIFSNDSSSLVAKIKAVLGIVIMPILSGGLYGYFTYDKTLLGIENSAFYLLYSKLPAKMLQCLGTGTNILVSAKLTLAGILELFEPLQGRSVKTAMGAAVAACAAGVATGLSHLNLHSTVSKIKSIIEVLYNFLYADFANLPFLIKSTGAEHLKQLINVQTQLSTVINCIEGDANLTKMMTAVSAKISCQIQEEEKGWGISTMGKKMTQPFVQMFYGRSEPQPFFDPGAILKVKSSAYGSVNSNDNNTPDAAAVSVLFFGRDQAKPSGFTQRSSCTIL